MARVNLPHTQITRAGVAPGAEVNGDAVNNHVLVNDGRVLLLVRNSNGGATARDLTIVVPGTVDGQAIADKVTSIAAGASRYFGPFPRSIYGNSIDVDVAHADLKLTAYRL